MDQNSTNDTEKRNWRERLGIGGKEMPRISGEFTKAPETLPLKRSRHGCAGPARGKTGAHGAAHAYKVRRASPVARPQQQMPPQGAPPQAPDALAEKLRSQRAAAEKLAEQRVTAAKQRAENAPVGPTVQPRPSATNCASATGRKAEIHVLPMRKPKQISAASPRALPPGRPPQRPVPQQPQLSPPRPPLGGQPRLPTGAPAAASSRSTGPSRHAAIRHRPMCRRPPCQQPQRSFNGPLSQPPAGEPRLQAPRVNPDAYRRGPQDDLGYAGAGYENPQRSLHNGRRALRGPGL